jgi:hypothetical protein
MHLREDAEPQLFRSGLRHGSAAGLGLSGCCPLLRFGSSILGSLASPHLSAAFAAVAPLHRGKHTQHINWAMLLCSGNPRWVQSISGRVPARLPGLNTNG